MEGTPTKNRTWFYFSLEWIPTPAEKLLPGLIKTIRITLPSLNRVQKLFNAGMRPVYRSQHTSEWRRVPTKPTAQLNPESDLNLSFTFTFSTSSLIPSSSSFQSRLGTLNDPAPLGRYYFSYCIPYTYYDLQIKLDSYLGRLNDGIYIHRDLLGYSKDGLRLDLLTISSNQGIIDDEIEPPVDDIFPEGVSCRLFDMSQKSFFFITSRVHPGETQASFILDGFIEFILSPYDLRAKKLRSLYVFKIIPMLNPDGVKRGHYRGDSKGGILIPLFTI